MSVLFTPLTISDVIEFLEMCFAHSISKNNYDNIVCDNFTNFEFLEISMDMPEIKLEFQDIVFDFADIKIDALGA